VQTALPDGLGRLRAAPAVELDAERVAADALDAQALASLLADAGFEAAVERTYSGPGSQIRRVAVRVIRFEDLAGAERYLSWLRTHADEVIGELAATVDTDAGPVFVHEPGGCCPKELPLAMAAWRAGSEVIRVILAGPAADGPAGVGLLTRLRELTAG
jgi:hypothetical protein